jgi:hypothetical protein
MYEYTDFSIKGKNSESSSFKKYLTTAWTTAQISINRQFKIGKDLMQQSL